MSERLISQEQALWQRSQHGRMHPEPHRLKLEWTAHGDTHRSQFSDLAFEGVSPEILDNPNEVLKFQLLSFNKALITYMTKEKERRIQRQNRQREKGLAKEGTALNKAFGVAIQAGYRLRGEEGAKIAFTSIKNTFTMATGINQRKFAELFPDAPELEKILLSGAITESAAPFLLQHEFGIQTYASTQREDMHGVDWWATPRTDPEHAGLADQHNLAWAIQVKASGSAENPLFMPYQTMREAEDRLIDFQCSNKDKESYLDACHKVLSIRDSYGNVEPVLFVLPNYYQNPGYYSSESSLPKAKLADDLDQQLWEISDKYELATQQPAA